jgi:hypothetical protein
MAHYGFIFEIKMDTYKLLNELGTHILASKGIIFGGYVRDTILHDHGAHEFYKVHPKATKQQYNDPSFHTETNDRLLIPNDIDVCFETYDAMNGWIADLKKRYGSLLMCRKSESTTGYMQGKRQFKIVCKFVVNTTTVKKFLPVPVSIDVTPIEFREIDVDVVISETMPTFGKLDYECNGLVMKGDQLMLSCDIDTLRPQKNLLRIIDDIKDKVAYEVTFQMHRFHKMMKRSDWKIKSVFIERLLNPVNEDCLFCHELIQVEDKVNLECCAAMYHYDCLIKCLRRDETGMIDRGWKCFHCRGDIFHIQKFDL